MAKYRPNDAAVAKSYAEGGASYDKSWKDTFPMYKMRDGTNKVRVLPRTWEDDQGPRHWAFPVFIHGSVGADNERYICPYKMKGDPCPVCEERAQVVAKGDDEDYAFKLKPYAQYACYVIDRFDEETGPKIMMMPASKVHAEICERGSDPDTGAILTIDHPEDGYDVTFKKSGSGMTGTKYTGVTIARSKSYLAEKVKTEAKWLDAIEDHPLTEETIMYDYDHINKAFQGAAKAVVDDDSGTRRSRRSRDDDDDAAEDEPRARRRGRDEEDEARSSRKRSRDEDAEDEPRARRRSRDDEKPKSRRRSRDDDDDDDDDDGRDRSKRKRKDDIDDEDDGLVDDPEDEGRDRRERSRGSEDTDGSRGSARKSLRDRVGKGLKRRDQT